MAWIIISVGVIFIAGYLYLVAKMAPAELWPARHTMFSVVISFVMAVAIGFLLFQVEVDALRSEKREDLVQIINNQLGVIEMLISTRARARLNLIDTTLYANIGLLPSSALEIAGSSALFDTVITWHILALDALIDDHNFYVSHLLSFQHISGYSGIENRIESAHNTVSIMQELILVRCTKLREEILIARYDFAEEYISKHKK